MEKIGHVVVGGGEAGGAVAGAAERAGFVGEIGAGEKAAQFEARGVEQRERAARGEDEAVAARLPIFSGCMTIMKRLCVFPKSPVTSAKVPPQMVSEISTVRAAKRRSRRSKIVRPMTSAR